MVCHTALLDVWVSAWYALSLAVSNCTWPSSATSAIRPSACTLDACTARSPACAVTVQHRADLDQILGQWVLRAHVQAWRCQ